MTSSPAAHAPPPVLIAVALRADDTLLVEALARGGLAAAPCAPDALDAAAGTATAVVADADLAGTLGAVARLRRSGARGAALPVVLVGEAGERASAHVDAVEWGADAFLPRPVDPVELAAQLRALLDRSAGAGAPDAATPGDSLGAPPGGLSGPLTAMLRAAVAREGGDPKALDLPDLGGESLDDLVPPELLEPLDTPFDDFVDDVAVTGAEPTGSGYGSTGRRSPGGVIGGVGVGTGGGARAAAAPTTLTPLPVDGDLRLSGALGRFGVAELLSAAARARGTGLLVVRAVGSRGVAGAEWALALSAGQLVALRGSRAEDQIGPLLVRLGYVPREAARFAAVPLDAGLRGAALLAARGYVAPDALAPALARAAQETLFDLLCLDAAEWEMRPLESVAGIPLPTRALDALLVLGARARIEPAVAYGVLGGDEARVTLRGDAAALGPLPLTAGERDAAAGARGSLVAALVRSHGEAVLPALAALYWLQHLSAEGPAHEPGATGVGPLGPERTRVRALAEAAAARDLCALLGVSPWATRAAVQGALDVRRIELDTLRARYPVTEVLPVIFAALDEAGQLLADPALWARYVAALRGAG